MVSRTSGLPGAGLSHARLRRRTLVAGGVTAMLGGAVLAQSGRKVVRWGQLSDVSSAHRRMGTDLALGTRLAFDEVNARGGMFGREIELETVDSMGDPKRMPAVVEGLKARDDLFGMVSIGGTLEAQFAIRALLDWPIFGATTGADMLRRAAPANVLFVRTSWGTEVDRLLGVAKNLGLTNIGVVYPEGPVGQAVQGLLDTVLGKYGLTLAVKATIPNPASLDVAPAAAKVRASAAQLVIVALASPAADFMLAARRTGFFGPMYTVSDAVGPEFTEKLKEKTQGIGFSSPIPNPWGGRLWIVRDYQSAMARAGKTSKDYSFASLEGYLNGRVLLEVLKRVGPDLTRERFLSAARILKIADLGGLGVDLTRGNTALSYTDVFVLGSNGRVLG